MNTRMASSPKGTKTWGGRRVLVAAVAIAVLVAGWGLLRGVAQQATPPAAPQPTGETPHPETSEEKPATIRATVQLVNVPVTVLNKRGMPVIDMNQEDFQILEDGVQQPITHFDRETRTPLRIGLILDTSNSARSRIQYEREAASEFVYVVLRNGGSHNQVFLQTFDATSSIIHDFTNDPDLLNEKIQELKSGGGKALYDAIYFACREKMKNAGPPEEQRRILVVLTDGLDVQSKHTLDEAISVARMTETTIFTIDTVNYGYDNPGDKLLDEISGETGGYTSYPLREFTGTDLETGYLSHGQIGETSQNKGYGAETGAFSAERMMHLADALQAIGRALDEQYTIGYRPLRDAMDGTWRSIKIVSSRRGVNMRWKPGYFARAQ